MASAAPPPLSAAVADGLSGAGAVQGAVAAPPVASPAPAVVEAAQGVVNTVQGAAQGLSPSTVEGASQAVGSMSAPVPMDSVFSWGGYFQAIGTLLLLLAVVWGLVYLLRKYGKFNFLPQPGAFPRQGMRLEAQLPLGPRKGLMVVRFLNKRLLLGVTDHQITLLKEVGDHDEEESLEFKEVMEDAQRQKADG